MSRTGEAKLLFVLNMFRNLRMSRRICRWLVDAALLTMIFVVTPQATAQSTRDSASPQFNQKDITDFIMAGSSLNVGRVRYWLRRGMNPDAGRDVPVLAGLLPSMNATVLLRILIDSGVTDPVSIQSCTKIVRLLLDAGADPNAIPNPPDPTFALPPIFFALEIDDPRSRSKTLQQKIDIARDMIVRMLLAKGADVNFKSDRGETPLMVAAEANRLAAVKEFLARGADVSAKRSDGKTAAAIARAAGNRAIADLLDRYK